MEPKERDRLIEVLKYLREGKNNLVMAALALDQMESFDKTVASIKEVVGDLVCAEKELNDFLKI